LKKIFVSFVICFFGFTVAISAQQASEVAPVAAGESILNLGPLLDVTNGLKTELRQYHDCTGAAGCYQNDLDAQADLAIAFLRPRAAHRTADEKLALILDIDETTLSNWAQMSAANFEYNSKDFNAWIAWAQAPAIPGTLRLFKVAEELGVSVVFITGRSEAQRAPLKPIFASAASTSGTSWSCAHLISKASLRSSTSPTRAALLRRHSASC
jgi:hypothetical protein